MKRSSRLKPIATIAAHREKEASQQMAASQAKLVEQERLLAELERYHAEYTATNVMSNVSGADPVRLQDYRVFLDRLQSAIASQQRSIAALRATVDADQTEWTDRRSQRKALDNAADRLARAEHRESDQREQLQVEEISALLRARRSAEPAS